MATVKLNTKEYKDTSSLKSVSPRFRIKNGRDFDICYRATDIKALIIDLCAFDSDILPTRRRYNLDLQQTLQKRQNLILSLLNSTKYDNGEQLLKAIDEAVESKPKPAETPKDLIYYYNEYINNQKRYDLITDSSIEIHTRSLMMVKRFAKYVKKSEIVNFSDLNKNWFFDFKDFLLHADDYGFRTNGEATCSLVICCLRTFLNDCVANNLLEYSPFMKMSYQDKQRLTSYPKKDVEALTIEDVERIKNLDLTDMKKVDFSALQTDGIVYKPHYARRLQLIKDYFLLQIYVGCRFSDVDKVFDVKYEKDELGLIPYVEFLPEKTKRNLKKQKMPLCLSAYNIIKNIKKPSFNEKLITYNRNIVKLFKLAGVNVNEMTSHIARRTHETLCYKFQPDMYLSGIHEKGSDAVKRYIADDMLTKLKIVCLTFKEPLYRVNEEGKVTITHEEEKELHTEDIKEFIAKFNELKNLLPEKKQGAKVYKQTIDLTDSISQLTAMANKLSEKYNINAE